jgi:dephospho-CoA kinase
MDEATARARMASQGSQLDKMAAADVVIDGSASMEETRRQVEKAFAALAA